MTVFPITSLPRLLQLCSTMLPVGAFSYSQGLESAIEARFVHDADSAMAWIEDVLDVSQVTFEAPLMLRMHQAWLQPDNDMAHYWNEYFIASRETAELRAETLQMGYSLVRLLEQLEDMPEVHLDALKQQAEVSFPCAFSLAASAWSIPPDAAVYAYLWSWLENQVSAAMKTVPLGQVAGQRILAGLGKKMPERVNKSILLEDSQLSNFSPMLAILSSQHEIQYSRLFRS